MELSEIYEKIQVLKELSQMEPAHIEYRLRAGFEGKIRAAQADIVKVEADYKAKVVRDCIVIAVRGKYSAEFARLSEQLHTLPVDFLKTVDMIGDSIIKRGGRDQYSTHEHAMAMDELNKIKMNYGISQLPVFQAKFDGVGPNTSIKEALYGQLTSQYGSQLYTAVSRGEIAVNALSIGFKGKKLPVVLYNYTMDLETSMLPSPVDVLEVNVLPTISTVTSALTDIRNRSISKEPN